MKKFTITVMALAVFSLVGARAQQEQYIMVVKKTTGDSLRLPASLLNKVYFMKGIVEPEPVIPPHATTYTWGQDLMYSGVLEQAVQSADSSSVTGVELKSDGAPWNN